MNELIPFTYEDTKVRVVEVDGEPWFVSADVLSILGLQRSSIATLDDDEKGVHSMDTPGGAQDRSVINEPGLYSLILRSRKPEAKRFKRWVTHDVIPAIRKTGSYGAPLQLTDEEIVHRALQITSEKVRELEAKVQADAPKVLFADAVAASHTSILVGELAKILRGNGVEVGQNRLFEWLRRDGYLIRRKGTDWNMPTQYSMEMGLFEIKETAITHSDGHVTVNKTSKVTGRGQQFFINKYAGKELVA